MLDHLRRLDCHKTNIYARFKDIRYRYEQIKSKLPTVNNNADDVQQLEKQLKAQSKASEKPWDVYFKTLDHKNSESSRANVI